MSNQNQNQPNRPMFNRGFITRANGATTEGCSARGNSLELWINTAVQKTVASTGEVVLELNTSGHFNSYNGIDYTLGKDVYADDTGLIWINCTAWGVVKDRLIKLDVRKGFRLRIYGVFQKETYQRTDGTQGIKVVCKSIQNFEVVAWPKDGNNASQPANNNGSVATSQPQAPVAPAPTPATNVQPTQPVQTAPVQAAAPTPAPTPTPTPTPAPTPTAPVDATPVAPSNTEVEVPF